MLLINTEKGQKVHIGTKLDLLVTDISMTNKTYSFQLQTKKGIVQKTIKDYAVGNTYQIQSNVAMTATRIVVGEAAVVILGFKAPRAVRIKGEWYSGKSKKKNYADMNIHQLITLTEQSSATELEKQLGRIIKQMSIVLSIQEQELQRMI